MVANSNASYFATCPISEPATTGFVASAEMGGFGWDETQGLFVLTPREQEPFVSPQSTPRVIDQP